MQREIHENMSEEQWLAMRAEDITSTEISALFGVSPYETPFELWHRKRGNIGSRFQENDRTILGQEIEPVIARALGRKFDVQVREFKSYIRIPELKLGCSFDWEYLDEERGGEWLNLEIKHLDWMVFKDKWKLWDGGVEPPLHILLQANAQLFARDQGHGKIGYLAGGTTLDWCPLDRHQPTLEKVVRKVEEFWESIDTGREPDPDYERDGDVLKALYAKPDPRATLSAEVHVEAMDAVAKATAAAAAKKAAEELEKAEKARLTRIMQDVPEALLPDGAKVLFRADKNGRRSMRLTAAPVPSEAAA